MARATSSAGRLSRQTARARSWTPRSRSTRRVSLGSRSPSRQALLKDRKFDAVVRNAVMLGVSAVRPLITAHADVPDAAIRGDSARHRWEIMAVASAKQCGRAVVPVIESQIAIDRHLLDAGEGLRLLLVEPAAGPSCGRLSMLTSRPRPQHATLTIGPEGGVVRGRATPSTPGRVGTADARIAYAPRGRRPRRRGLGAAVSVGRSVEALSYTDTIDAVSWSDPG